ncbi:expressed unknown protein [Seminavis robusta]|uniref:VWFD domain-containing protein n=1 Tax=Seminavis robusta TaxID=568900 RepID=A0A9N8E3V9_9STRA|nr:expressed unknown protein [Seminavis robusta]|eukprot:Sro517_g158730.1 n/a (450) ;mRNA; r:55357-56805
MNGQRTLLLLPLLLLLLLVVTNAQADRGDCCTDASCSNVVGQSQCYRQNVEMTVCQDPQFPLPYFRKYLNGVDETGGTMCVYIPTNELLGECCMTSDCNPNGGMCYPLETVSSCRAMVAQGMNLPYFRDFYNGNACHELARYGSCCYTADCNDETCRGSLLPEMCQPKGYAYFRNHNSGGCESVRSGGEADPHIQKFNGRWFDYQGECDLVMAHVPQFTPHQALDLHIRTKIRYDYSYIHAAALRIGNDTLEVASWGNYAVNGVDTPRLEGSKRMGSTSDTFPIYHRQPQENHTIVDIVLSQDSNITMGSFKDMVFVRFTGATRFHFGSTLGLMGNFRGDMMARDGTTDLSNDITVFGQEWQVRPDIDVPGNEEEKTLFRALDGPQYPEESCRLPPPQRLKGTSASSSKGVSKKQAQEACAHWTDPQRQQGCISDVLVTGDIDIARAMG